MSEFMIPRIARIQKNMDYYAYVLLSSILWIITACNNALSDPVVPRIDADNVYWKLLINYRAINLAVVAPYNTVQLHVSPQNAQGVSIPDWDPGAVTWKVLDEAKLRIDSTGTLTAIGTGSNIRVIATLQIGTVTHVDTALVTVTATAPVSPLKTLSLQTPDGMYTIAQFGTARISPTAKDETDKTISGLQVAYWSVNPRIVGVKNNGITNATISGLQTGQAMIFADTYAYGVYAVDSVLCHVGLSARGIFTVVLENDGHIGVYPSSMSIVTGGIIMWRDDDYRWVKTTPAPQVTFDSPERALRVPEAEGLFQPVEDQGDIPSRILIQAPFSYPYLGVRRFEEPGTYRFYVGPDRVMGQVVVLEQ